MRNLFAALGAAVFTASPANADNLDKIVSPGIAAAPAAAPDAKPAEAPRLATERAAVETGAPAPGSAKTVAASQSADGIAIDKPGTAPKTRH